MDVYAHYAHEEDYPDLDYAGAERRLAQAIALRTISECEEPAPFVALHEIIR